MEQYRNLFTPVEIEGDCVCFDMDGVIAVWGTEGQEPTFQPGYFLARPSDKRALKLIKSLDDEGLQIVILSAVYTDGTAAKDKKAWLDNHGLNHVKTVFVPYGSGKKKDYVVCSGKKLLIDDYSKNLHEWEEDGGIGIKYMNGVNGSKGTWTNLILTESMTVEEMKEIIKSALKGD